jgi:hypothetical protein
MKSEIYIGTNITYGHLPTGSELARPSLLLLHSRELPLRLPRFLLHSLIYYPIRPVHRDSTGDMGPVPQEGQSDGGTLHRHGIVVHEEEAAGNGEGEPDPALGLGGREGRGRRPPLLLFLLLLLLPSSGRKRFVKLIHSQIKRNQMRTTFLLPCAFGLFLFLFPFPFLCDSLSDGDARGRDRMVTIYTN